jgi:poly-gamma-glutamate capsule biosynthesis protein CapA/YwtB (metallophosphatase superfamily)
VRRIAFGLLALVMASASSAPPSAAAEIGRSFTITAGGDILIHRSIAQLADDRAPGAGVYDFTSMLAPIEPWVAEADLAICHLEGALDPENTDLAYYPRFNAPHEVAEALAAAGYDACSTAGNHTLDHGFTGLADTLAVLDEAGLGHSGSARTLWERLASLYEVNGVTVAHLSYTYGTNGIPLPDGRPWAVNLIGNGDGILADARLARWRGAEFVIVSLHWGTEYQIPPTPGQIDLAERLLQSPDVDLILGTHVHVVQPIGRVGDKVVVYGMGNQISNMRAHDGHRGTEDGILVHLAVEEIGGRFVVTGTAFTPTWVHPVTKEVLPVAHTLAYGPDAYRWDLGASLARSVDRVTRLGAPGVTLSATPWPVFLCRGLPATVVGTAGPNVLTGTDGPDVIVGRGGNDRIDAGGGDDLVCAGEGDDVVRGGPGRDVLYGGPGDDILYGDEGNDRLHGEEGNDRLAGGGDNDTLAGGEGDDHLYGDEGNDLLISGPGRDLLWGGTGTDLLVAFSAQTLLRADADDTCRMGAGLVPCP